MSKIQKSVLNYLSDKSNQNFEQVLKCYQAKFKYTSSRWKQDQEDIENQMRFVLWKALEGYDTETNASFNTFFWKCWQNYAGSIKIRKTAKKRIQEQTILPLNAKISDDQEDEHIEQVEDMKRKYQYDESIKKIDFYRLIEQLPMKPKERKMLQLFYETQSLKLIAEEMKCTVSNVCICIKRMKDKPYANELYSFLKEAIL